MLDKETLDALQESKAISAARETLNDSFYGKAFVALPDHFTTHDLENIMPTRRRARGVMGTSVLKAFAKYTSDHKEAGASVFVDTESFTATAVLNLGTPTAPGHTDNRAKLQPKKTAAYSALKLHTNGQALKQATAAEFLEDWAECMQFFNDDGAITPPKAIAALRKLSIEAMRKLESSEQSLSASRSTFENVQATSVDPIPTTVYFKCKPYTDLAERTFVLRLGVLTGGDKPQVMLRITKQEEHDEEMATELAELIADSIVDIPVLLGTYSKS